jgi:hypothetical protein
VPVARDYLATMITPADFLFFVDEALDGMTAILRDLDEEMVNRRLDVAGANSAFAVVAHCLGVMEYWAGHLVAGRAIERDREAEFVARGSVADLLDRVQRARLQLRRDIDALDATAPLRNAPEPEDADLPFGQTQGAALFHLYEELAQHRGQLEGHRDVMCSAWARLQP